jgi:hypothetical protein
VEPLLEADFDFFLFFFLVWGFFNFVDSDFADSDLSLAFVSPFLHFSDLSFFSGWADVGGAARCVAERAWHPKKGKKKDPRSTTKL